MSDTPTPAQPDEERAPYAVITTAERTVRQGRNKYTVPAGHVVRILWASPNKLAEHSAMSNLAKDERLLPQGEMKVGDQT